MAVISGGKIIGYGNVATRSARPVFTVAGVPVDGTSGTAAGVALPGDLCLDTTGKIYYVNMNTQASPTWEVLGEQTVA